MRLFRVLVYMLGSWVGGVWIAWGMTGYITETLCAGTTWQWIWLVLAALLAAALAYALTREVRAGRLYL